MAIVIDTAGLNNILDNGAASAYGGSTVELFDNADPSLGASLVSITLPAYSAASLGTIEMASTPTGTAGVNAGVGTVALSYRCTFTGGGTEEGLVDDSGGTNGQGGGAADMVIDNVTIVENGVVTITSFDVSQSSPA